MYDCLIININYLIIFLAYKLSLKDWPLCTVNNTEAICDIPHLLFSRPFLFPQRQSLSTLLNSPNIYFNSQSIFSSRLNTVIFSVIFFINQSSFVI